MRLYKISVKRSSAKGQWYWNLVHWNGKQICRSSETYQRRWDCVRALERMLVAIKANGYETEIG